MQTRISSILAAHITSVYHAMEEKADDNSVYTGSRAELVRSLGISSTFYAPIFRALEQGGFCALMDRGGRSKPSKVLLIQEPTTDLLIDLTINASEPILSLMNRLDVIDRSLGGMNVIAAMEQIDSRLSILESKLEDFNGKAPAPTTTRSTRPRKSK